MVEQGHLAVEIGSGTVPVLGTPALIGFMESVASDLAQKDLTPEYTTVGVSVKMKHLRASLEGASIEVRAVIKKLKERTAVFKIEAYDSGKLVGSAKHKRVLIHRKQFEKSIGLLSRSEKPGQD